MSDANFSLEKVLQSFRQSRTSEDTTSIDDYIIGYTELSKY